MWWNGASRYDIITIVLAVRNNGKMQLTPYKTETRILYYLHLHYVSGSLCTCEQTKSQYYDVRRDTITKTILYNIENVDK